MFPEYREVIEGRRERTKGRFYWQEERKDIKTIYTFLVLLLDHHSISITTMPTRTGIEQNASQCSGRLSNNIGAF